MAITEFGCCTYAGAAARGARGWMIVDRSATPWRLHGPHHPDPTHDLDLASYGLIRLTPDLTRHPKAAFHTLATAWARTW